MVRSAFEIFVALLSLQLFVTEGIMQWVYCYSLFALVAVRTVYKDHLDMTAFMFVIVYFS